MKSQPTSPIIGIDGNCWYLLIGADLMSGHAGFGRTIAEAKADFEKSGRFHVRRIQDDAGADCGIADDITPEQWMEVSR